LQVIEATPFAILFQEVTSPRPSGKVGHDFAYYIGHAAGCSEVTFKAHYGILECLTRYQTERCLITPISKDVPKKQQKFG
jgi:hypothetical protein